jgi:GxxExxY protein
MALLLEALTRMVIGAFYRVYKALGYGLLENAYVGALQLELARLGLTVRREVPVQAHYRGVPVGHYRIDLLVNEVLIVEVKTATTITENDERQLRNYLRCSHLEVGLLFNFGPAPKFRRFVYSAEHKRHELIRNSRLFPPIQ